MNKSALTLLTICCMLSGMGQSPETDKIIELSKAYKNFMFRNEPGKAVFKDLKKDVPENLKTATAFIIQTISSDTRLLKKDYLILPDTETIKVIYIIRAINLNLREEDQINNSRLVDSLKNKNIPRYELIDNYYDMLFAAVGNKIPEFDLSDSDFKLKEYNLVDDTEKGIFFFRCMALCGAEIWGYMNIVKPPNTRKAYAYIKKYPKFNGSGYFQYTDLYFPDFEMNIVKDQGIQSYKSYYINKYFEVLINHLTCLNKEGASEKEKNDLLLGSVLKERNLYKYTKYAETLEEVFKEQKVQ